MEKKHKVWDNGMTVRGQPGIKFIEWQVVNTKSVANFYQKYFGCNVYNHTHYCDKKVNLLSKLLFKWGQMFILYLLRILIWIKCL